MKKLFIAFLLLSSIAVSFAADYEDPTGAGVAQEGTDVGFANVTATTVVVSDYLYAEEEVYALYHDTIGNNTALHLLSLWTMTSADREGVVMSSGNWTASSGISKAVIVDPRYNQSGTAGATDLLIRREEVGLGSGPQLLIDAHVDDVSQFKVSTEATMTLTPQASAPASCSIGDIYVDTSGAYCGCGATDTWSNMIGTGTCS